MFEDYYMTVDDVAKLLKISKSFAYKIIRKMNSELKAQGFFTMAGRVNKKYFLEKTCYNKMFCDKGEKLCYYSKHSRRVEWIKSHINDVVSHYKLTGDKWKVDDVLILSEPFPSNEYYHRNKKILLYADLSERNIMSI